PIVRLGLELSQPPAGFERQRRGSRKADQLLAPERLGLRLILLLQPSDVIAIGPAGWQLRLVSLRERLVAREELLQQQRDAPAVENGMMEAPQELMVVGSQAEHRQAQQRRLLDVKATLSIGLLRGAH